MYGKTVSRQFESEDALLLHAQAGDERALEYLLTEFAPLRRLIGWLARTLDPDNLARADLEAAGRLAALEALRRFDAARGVRFTTYGYNWIRGAMLQTLYVHVERRRANDDGERPPRVRLISIHDASDPDSDFGTEYEGEILRRDPDYGLDSGYVRLESAERAAAVRNFVDGLPEAQREITAAVFWSGRTHGDVATERGVSRPAISRTLARVFSLARIELRALSEAAT